jgi:hypothetical protein
MSKRPRDDDTLIKNEVNKRFVYPPPSSGEISAIQRLLRSKLDNLYQDFLAALSESRYGRFMITGVIGKRRQEEYRPFYERLLREGFIRHFITMIYYLRVLKPENEDYIVLMSDVFQHIYKAYLIDKVYLGNYITHTETIAVESVTGNLFVIKNNDNAYNNKRLLLHYENSKDSFYLDRAGFVSRDIEIVSVVSNSNMTIFLGFNNDLYMIIRGSQEVQVIESFSDDRMELVSYKKEGIRIKGLFSTKWNIYLLTTLGKVFMIGDTTHSQLTPKSLDRIKHLHVPLAERNGFVVSMVNYFTPIKMTSPKTPHPVIVHISEPYSDGIPILIDEHNVVYQLNDSTGTFDKMSDEDAALTYLADVESGHQREWRMNLSKKLLHFDEHYDLSLGEDGNTLSEEYWSDETHLLTYHMCDSELYVLLTNQKIYHFTPAQWNDHKYKLVQVILNKPIAWNETVSDTWIFQCHQCGTFSSLNLDPSTDSVFCTPECQLTHYKAQVKHLFTSSYNHD